jgi:lipid-A-disaccharide synthase
VDYPGFNLRAARAARKRGIRVVYYIAPQIWAWAPWRVRRIARAVDRVLTILPFERELYARGGVPCAFVGHPLFERLQATAPATDRGDRPVELIGLLPGSRSSEVRGTLPSMLRAARRVLAAHPGTRFVLPCGGPRVREEVEGVLGEEGDGLPIEVVEGRTHEAMDRMDLALVASGTASLELLYYRVPMVVMYRVGRLARLLGRFLLITPHVALVNIVAGRRIMPELLGPGDLSAPAFRELSGWIEDPAKRRASREALEGARSRLLFEGVAQRAAEWALRKA